MPPRKTAIFNGKKINKVFYNGQWWFPAKDVVSALTGRPTPADHWLVTAVYELIGGFGRKRTSQPA